MGESYETTILLILTTITIIGAVAKIASKKGKRREPARFVSEAKTSAGSPHPRPSAIRRPANPISRTARVESKPDQRIAGVDKQQENHQLDLWRNKDAKFIRDRTPGSNPIVLREPGPLFVNPNYNDVGDNERKAIAAWQRDEANDSLKEAGTLRREIIARGGIARHKNGSLSEEYNEIPISYRRKAGLPADEMASEMGITETELMASIKRAEAVKGQLPVVFGKRKRYFTAKDFL